MMKDLGGVVRQISQENRVDTYTIESLGRIKYVISVIDRGLSGSSSTDSIDSNLHQRVGCSFKK